ncbi:MAG: hypothetical protein ACKO4T_08250 [Planctomycetaceae bacterium]
MAMMLVVVTAVVGPHACGGYVPPTFTGTGPYRRVYSATGASYLSVSVFLPGSSQVTMSGSDTAYVYVGGWGANGAGAVDAGFQYSPTFNNWSLFAAGVGVGRVNYGTSATRMAANQTVQLSFAVTQSGTNVTLTVQATGTQINNAGLVTQSVALANVAGWSPGGQNTLKRMTSIAQVGGDNFTSGSRIAGVAWTSAVIGLDAASAVTWTGGGVESYPTTPGVVSVQYTNAANEIDAINLVAVPEPAVAWFATPLVAGLAWSGRGRRDRLIPQMPSHEPRE